MAAATSATAHAERDREHRGPHSDDDRRRHGDEGCAATERNDAAQAEPRENEIARRSGGEHADDADQSDVPEGVNGIEQTEDGVLNQPTDCSTRSDRRSEEGVARSAHVRHVEVVVGERIGRGHSAGVDGDPDGAQHGDHRRRVQGPWAEHGAGSVGAVGRGDLFHLRITTS